MNNIEKKKTSIPYSTNKTFVIKKAESWENCIEIKFDPNETNFEFNLYNILKSYAFNTVVPCHYIAFGMLSFSEKKIIIFEKEQIFSIKKMSYFNFLEWISWRILNDRKYNVDANFYSILLQFEKKIVEEKKIDLNEMSPIYPWREEWINFLKVENEEIEVLKNKLKIYEKKIKELEDIIKK